MLRKILESLNLVKTIPPKPTNPYSLLWYRQGWSESKIKKNNTKFWKWEALNN